MAASLSTIYRLIHGRTKSSTLVEAHIFTALKSFDNVSIKAAKRIVEIVEDCKHIANAHDQHGKDLMSY